jgi:hypothetical protein
MVSFLSYFSHFYTIFWVYFHIGNLLAIPLIFFMLNLMPFNGFHLYNKLIVQPKKRVFCRLLLEFGSYN